jgi:hypothetical protein
VVPTAAEKAAIARLRDPVTIRERCREILARAEEDELRHFRLHRERLDAAVDYVVATIADRYPHLDVPFHSRWRHFETGGIDRWASLAEKHADADGDTTARMRIDLAVTSVLLDAGAGDAWRYKEPSSGAILARSEGLAVASLHMFESGAFSSRADQPLRADAHALLRIRREDVDAAFQVRTDNPLVGVAGRATLLRDLGAALGAHPALFGEDEPRVGNLYDHLVSRAAGDRLSAREIFAAVLEGFASIWPGRIRIGHTNLGDVWHHDCIRCDDASDGLVPFHKLSQWLTYSLVEPLEDAGLRICDLDALTGLAEYRNGGLFLDLGVLAWRSQAEAARRHDVGSEPVVEWRALTIALLDELAERLRARLHMDAAHLPLVKILEGGTWAAGRRAAYERRAGGAPPFAIASDGTVF